MEPGGVRPVRGRHAYVLMEGQATTLNDLVDHPLTVVDGQIVVPDRPGIGLDIIGEMLDRYPFQPHQIAPPLRPDGSVAH